MEGKGEEGMNGAESVTGKEKGWAGGEWGGHWLLGPDQSSLELLFCYC